MSRAKELLAVALAAQVSQALSALIILRLYTNTHFTMATRATRAKQEILRLLVSLAVSLAALAHRGGLALRRAERQPRYMARKPGHSLSAFLLLGLTHRVSAA